MAYNPALANEMPLGQNNQFNNLNYQAQDNENYQGNVMVKDSNQENADEGQQNEGGERE